MINRKLTFISTFVFGIALGTSGVFAQAAVMKECGAEWQAAKTANTVKAGETWNSFLAECRTRKAAATPAAATPAAPATAAAPKPAPVAPTVAPAAPAAAGAKPATSGQQAERTRQKACGAEWRANKVALVAKQPGLTWPKYWSECNTRMKAAGQ